MMGEFLMNIVVNHINARYFYVKIAHLCCINFLTKFVIQISSLELHSRLVGEPVCHSNSSLEVHSRLVGEPVCMKLVMMDLNCMRIERQVGILRPLPKKSTLFHVLSVNELREFHKFHYLKIIVTMLKT